MKRIALLVSLLALSLVHPAGAVVNEVMYASSHTATADTSAQLTPGRSQLFKIIVSSAGTGSALVTVKDTTGGTLAVLDATAVRDQQYDITASTGLVYTTAGTAAPQVTFIYARPGVWFGSTGGGPYSVLHSTGVYTTRAIKAGRVFLKRIIVGKAGTAPSAVTVYNSNGTSTGPIVDIINAESVRSVDYNVIVSSGLTYTSTGNPGVTFVYGNTR
jgi:hypothetical protein